MSIQINFNIQGSPGADLVEWVIDNAHRYPVVADLPNRMIVRSTEAEPSPYGSHIEWKGQILAYLGVPPDPGGPYEAAAIGMNPPFLVFRAPAPAQLLPSIVGDHFELNGNRWVWRMTDGFLDHYWLFLGNVQRVRDCYKQAQDLDSRGRRVFGMVKNIPGDLGLPPFDPRTDDAKFWATFDQLLEISAEFGQPLDYNVFPDAQLLGMDLGWCQAHWAHVRDRYRGKLFQSLTNEFDHGGNLVGRPNDYPNPGGLASQGSAVQDATPPNPAMGTGSGYQIWEWHAADDPTHFSHEYYIWKGRSTGRVLPCVITEHGRRIEEGSVDLDYIRTLTHASMANGLGLTIHSTAGKYSQVLGPNTAGAVKLSMSLLAAGQA